MEISKILKDAKEKHNIDVDEKDENIRSLICYVYNLAFNDGWKNHEMFVKIG